MRKIIIFLILLSSLVMAEHPNKNNDVKTNPEKEISLNESATPDDTILNQSGPITNQQDNLQDSENDYNKSPVSPVGNSTDLDTPNIQEGLCLCCFVVVVMAIFYSVIG